MASFSLGGRKVALNTNFEREDLDTLFVLAFISSSKNSVSRHCDMGGIYCIGPSRQKGSLVFLVIS
jgi:hypothetical protein